MNDFNVCNYKHKHNTSLLNLYYNFFFLFIEINLISLKSHHKFITWIFPRSLAEPCFSFIFSFHNQTIISLIIYITFFFFLLHFLLKIICVSYHLSFRFFPQLYAIRARNIFFSALYTKMNCKENETRATPWPGCTKESSQQ